MSGRLTPGRHVARCLLIVLLFIVAGPPIGLIVYMVTVSLVLIRGLDDVPRALFAPVGGLMLAPLSYLVGLIPAAIAGIVMALWYAVFAPPRGWMVAVLGFLGGCGLIYATDGLGTLPHFPREIETVLGLMTGSIAATLVPWLMVRSRLPRHQVLDAEVASSTDAGSRS